VSILDILPSRRPPDPENSHTLAAVQPLGGCLQAGTTPTLRARVRLMTTIDGLQEKALVGDWRRPARAAAAVGPLATSAFLWTVRGSVSDAAEIVALVLWVVVALPVSRGSRTIGHFLVTASAKVTYPSREERRVAVLLADQVAGALGTE
jgi:hypothetical protein